MIKKTYTPRQLEVINAKSGYNMVLAGPGCGKTDILAERLARAYESGNVELSEMLCLTFTNRAARSMYSRIQERLGGNSGDLFVGNIHRYCSHFLFEYGVVSAESTILDEDDINEVLTSEITDDDIKELIEYKVEQTSIGSLAKVNWETINGMLEIDIHPSGSTGKITDKTVKRIINAVRYKVMDMQHLMCQIEGEHPVNHIWHNEMLDNPWIKSNYPFIRDFKDACIEAQYNSSRFHQQNSVDKIISLAAKYGAYKESNGLLDFDDLLIRTYDAYHNDIEHKYPRFKWVQIDEIQDLSNFQIALVDQITDTTNDFVVLYLGDDQQAIYSFMGASIDTLTTLKNRCLNHIYRLDKNFRSPKYLLDLYNEYAIKELNVDKDLLPEPRDSQEAGFHDICIHQYLNTDEESNRVYNAILPFLRNEEHKGERTALLVPWNIDANEISDTLNHKDIPHFKISGLDSFQTVHMRTLMAHFNAVDNDFNMIAWSRILKQTFAVDTYSQGRHLIEEMRNIGMCPSDLLRDWGTYLFEFIDAFDNEEIVLYDTETTGVDVFNDDIVQIAAIKLRNGAKVPGSEFNIFLHTDKEIPIKLGKNINPMVKAYNEAVKFPRAEGLQMFMEYIGNRPLLGHNINYDYNILCYNLRRYCETIYSNFETRIFDTLKLAHLICPRMRKYNLEYLIDRLGLNGKNSHMADDDIIATYELAKYCRINADTHIPKQQQFFERKDVVNVINELNTSYRSLYETTKNKLYVLRDANSSYAIVDEMIESSDILANICEFKQIERFDLIIDFLNEDIISSDETNALKSHFQNHLTDMTTYREADLCARESFKEKLFVSTVHKAKGLEFENVLVMRSINGRYPHFAHITKEQMDEDKRLFYVAISRAMKRLIVSGSQLEGLTPFILPIINCFTIRFLIFRYLVEIGKNEARISLNGIVIRKYYDISSIYENQYYENSLSLVDAIRCQARPSDLIETVDSIFSKCGIQANY